VGIERIERVSANLACLDLAQDRPDDPGDVAPVGGEGGFGEIGDLEVLVEDLAEEDIPGGSLIAARLPEQPGEPPRLVRACLSEWCWSMSPVFARFWHAAGTGPDHQLGNWIVMPR
jgi:hypothetical protein